MSHYMGSERYWMESAQYEARSESPCVCDVVRRIHKAQNEARNKSNSSCDDSIWQLKNQTKHRKKPRHTTIPFMLYPSGSGDPFIGSGVIKVRKRDGKRSNFECIETPIVRVKHLSENSCCAELELLLPVTDNHTIPKQNPEAGKSCKFFLTAQPITGFIATEICITVDLNSYSAISCLDPITPLPAAGRHPKE